MSWRRAVRITVVFARHLLFYPFTGERHLRLGARLRHACEELGPVFVKIGQALSTRYDVLDRKDCEALQDLLDNMWPIPAETVEALFLADFGVQPEELYAEFSRAPLASASIAQVHRARLRDGRDVAVKIRRPGITEHVSADIGVLRRLARIAQFFSGALRRLQADQILGQLEEWIIGEADFRREAEHLQFAEETRRFHADEGDEYAQAIVLPEVCEELCSENVITMTFIDGIPALHFDAATAGPAYDAKQSLGTLLRASTRGWMQDEKLLFNPDPHPANIIIMPGGKVGVVDFGLFASLTREQVRATRNLLLAVYAQNIELTIRYSIELSGAPHDPYAERIRADLAEYLKETRRRGVGFWFVEIVRIFVRNRVPFPLPHELVLFGRGNILMDGLFETLVPGTTTLEVMGDELRRGMYAHIRRNIEGADLAPVLYAVSEKLKEGPQELVTLIERYALDPLSFVADMREKAGHRASSGS